jgi:hypothetical protein
MNQEESPMKTSILVCCLALAATPLRAVDPAAMKTPSGWFDMTGCAFCKHLVENPQLLDHVSWETHLIKQGMLYITVVDPAYADAYVQANQAMETLGNDMMAGKIDPATVKMCGSCQEFGMLMMNGVNVEVIRGDAADVTLVTATDPQMIAKIHAFAERNQREFALLANDAATGLQHAH